MKVAFCTAATPKMKYGLEMRQSASRNELNDKWRKRGGCSRPSAGGEGRGGAARGQFQIGRENSHTLPAPFLAVVRREAGTAALTSADSLFIASVPIVLVSEKLVVIENVCDLCLREMKPLMLTVNSLYLEQRCARPRHAPSQRRRLLGHWVQTLDALQYGHVRLNLIRA